MLPKINSTLYAFEGTDYESSINKFTLNGTECISYYKNGEGGVTCNWNVVTTFSSNNINETYICKYDDVYAYNNKSGGYYNRCGKRL
jgi:hypothetical protein